MDVGKKAPTPKPEDLPLLGGPPPSAPDDDDDSDGDQYLSTEAMFLPNQVRR